jgi:hypothetical protein
LATQNDFKKKLPSDLIAKVINKSLWLLKKMKRFTHPRLTYLCQYPFSSIVNGLFIAFLGLLLALPLPIPLSNMVAAWAIFLISLGVIENDGIFVGVGYLITVVCFVFFGLIIFFSGKLTCYLGWVSEVISACNGMSDGLQSKLWDVMPTDIELKHEA